MSDMTDALGFVLLLANSQHTKDNRNMAATKIDDESIRIVTELYHAMRSLERLKFIA